MMRYNLILAMSEDTDIAAVDADGHYLVGDEAISAIHSLFTKYPDRTMIGTASFNGNKIVHASIDTDAANPVLLVDALILNFELTDWVLLAMQTHFDQDQGEDGEGNPLPRQANKLMEPDPSLLDFINETLDENDKPIPKSMDQLSVWSGQAKWRA